MKFFKDNSYDIVKLLINQIGITIFSFMLYSATGVTGNADTSKLINVFISIFAIGFYLVLIYTATWDMGAKDKLRIDAGRMEPQQKKGLWMALFANIPNFLFAILSLLGYLLHLIFGGAFFSGLYAVCNLILRIAMLMYTGVVVGIFNELVLWQTVLLLICPVFSILVAHLGYTFGCRERRILDLFKAKEKE